MFRLPFWKRVRVNQSQPGDGIIGRALGEIFYPGADINAPVTKATDPEILVTGTGYIPQFWGLAPFQPPPVRAYMIAGQAGLGGAQAGAIYSSPLVDPNSLNPANDTGYSEG